MRLGVDYCPGVAQESAGSGIGVHEAVLPLENQPGLVALRHAAFPDWIFEVGLTAGLRVVHFAVQSRSERPDRAKAMRAKTRALMEDRVPPQPRWTLQGDGPALTARQLRRIPVGELVDAARRYIRSDALARLRPLLPHDTPGTWAYEFEQAPRPGRRGRGDRFYAEVAALYVRALDRPAPVKQVATWLKYSTSRVRDLLHEARRRGLLTGSPRGRAGGELTQRGRDLLVDNDGG